MPVLRFAGLANLHEYERENDGFLVARPAKAAIIGGTFFTIPIYAGLRSNA